MLAPKLLILLAQLVLLCYAGENAERAVTTTVYYTPTSSYASVYVTTSLSTSLVAVTQQPNVVITLTSYIPCPVTSTVWVYECSACQALTVTQATTAVQVTQAVQVGTTTQTLYTTTTPSVGQLTSTYTSNGYVVIVVNPTTTAASTTTTVAQAAIVAASSPKVGTEFSWLAMFVVAILLSMSIWL